LSKLIDARALNVEEFSFDFLIPAIIDNTNSVFRIKKPKDITRNFGIYRHGAGSSIESSENSDHLIWHYLSVMDNDMMLDISQGKRTGHDGHSNRSGVH
jgi:hypothetical protein